jgi:hypothetical protein
MSFILRRHGMQDLIKNRAAMSFWALQLSRPTLPLGDQSIGGSRKPLP